MCYHTFDVINIGDVFFHDGIGEYITKVTDTTGHVFDMNHNRVFIDMGTVMEVIISPDEEFYYEDDSW